MTPDDIAKLQATFPDERICIKVQSLNRDKTRALLVQYLQHTDVAARLDEVDPTWAAKIHKVEPLGELVFVHMELTVLGVSRDNVGEGQDPKSAASDALKRCAMLFGVGRYLYDQTKVRVDYNEASDKYREWTLEDYRGSGHAPEPPAPPARPRGKPAVQPLGLGKSNPVRSKRVLIEEIVRFQKLLKLSESDLKSWARECGGVSPDRMDVGQLEELAGQLQLETRKAGHRK